MGARTIPIGLFEREVTFDENAEGDAKLKEGARDAGSNVAEKSSYRVHLDKWRPTYRIVKDGSNEAWILERTVPLSVPLLFAWPVLFFFRHLVSAFGNVPTAILATIPFVGLVSVDSFTSVRTARLRPQMAIAVAFALVLSRLVVGCSMHPVAVVADDSPRRVGAQRLPVGGITWLRDPTPLHEAETDGCAWVDGKPHACFSALPFASPADGLLDALDAHFGTPLTRLRCDEDRAVVSGAGSTGPEEIPCIAAQDVPPETTGTGVCSVAIREAVEGKCAFKGGLVNAWLAFPQQSPDFLARARPQVPGGGDRTGLDCSTMTADGMRTCKTKVAAGTTLTWGLDVERISVDGLCPDSADSVCTVRSVQPTKLPHVPIPTRRPVLIDALTTSHQHAQTLCTFAEAPQSELQLRVVDDAKWVTRVRLVGASNTTLVECVPAADASHLALPIPAAADVVTSVEVYASDTPSTRSIIPMSRKIKVSFVTGQREWEVTTTATGLRYARIAQLGDCPKQPSSLTVVTKSKQSTVKASWATGSVDALFLVGPSSSTVQQQTGQGDDKRGCSDLTDPDDSGLPAVLLCGKAAAPDGFGTKDPNKKAKAPWCSAESSN